MKSLLTLESFLSNSGLYIQLFPGIYLSDLIRLRYKEDLSIALVKNYLAFISESEFSFKYSPENRVDSSRAVLLFANWRMAVVVTDKEKSAFLIGKNWVQYNFAQAIPPEIRICEVEVPENLHVSYYFLAIARHIVAHSPDSESFQRLVKEACEMANIEETIQEVTGFIYSNSLKTQEEIESYIGRYNELLDQDSLNYSNSEDLSILDSIIGKPSKMSDWIGRKMKSSMNESESSVIQFDALTPPPQKSNPFDLASSIDDRSSINYQTVTVDEIIDSNFVNSLLDLGNKRKTIIMQVEDKPESCNCGLCPIY